MRRPTINCGSPIAEHMMIAPTTMIEDPAKMVFRRPRISPMKMQEMAPEKQPRLYEATEIANLMSAICYLLVSLTAPHLE